MKDQIAILTQTTTQLREDNNQLKHSLAKSNNQARDDLTATQNLQDELHEHIDKITKLNNINQNLKREIVVLKDQTKQYYTERDAIDNDARETIDRWRKEADTTSGQIEIVNKQLEQNNKESILLKTAIGQYETLNQTQQQEIAKLQTALALLRHTVDINNTINNRQILPITTVAPTRQMAELVITQNTKALQDLHKSSVLQTLPYFDGSTNVGIRSWLHQLETMTSGWDGDRIETIIKLKLLNKAKAYSDRLFREYAVNNPGQDFPFIDWKKSMITHFDKPVEEYQRLFHQARQETHDSVDDFVEKLSNLYKNGFETGNADYTQLVYVNIADEVKTRALLKGLSREITDIL